MLLVVGLVFCCCLLLFILGGGGGFYYYRKQQAENKTTEAKLMAEKKAIEEEAARVLAEAEKKDAAEKKAAEEEAAKLLSIAEEKAAEAEAAKLAAEKKAAEEEAARIAAEKKAAEEEAARIAAEKKAAEEPKPAEEHEVPVQAPAFEVGDKVRLDWKLPDSARDLCAPTSGQSHAYGTVKKATPDNVHVQWDLVKTPAPRSGLSAHQCCWKRSPTNQTWNMKYWGDADKEPTYVSGLKSGYSTSNAKALLKKDSSGGNCPTDPVSTTNAAPETEGVSYTFHQGMDSGGYDMSHQGGLANNIPGLKAWCTEREACKGFNTNGWMKNTIRPQSQWYQWEKTGDPNKGMFVKNS
jgi:hypothetical protein